MYACPTKPGPRGANDVGEQHVQMWHVLNVHKCVLLGKEFSLFPLLIDYESKSVNSNFQASTHIQSHSHGFSPLLQDKIWSEVWKQG